MIFLYKQICTLPNINCLTVYFIYLFVASVVIQRSLPSIPVLILSLACIIALMLPTEGDQGVNVSIPKYLYLSVNQKLIAAFILGKLHMQFFYYKQSKKYTIT